MFTVIFCSIQYYVNAAEEEEYDITKLFFTKFSKKKSIKRLKITMLRFVVVIHLESLACHPQ